MTSSQNFVLQFSEMATFLQEKHLEYLPLWASQHHQIPQMRPCCNKFSLRRKDWLASFSCYSSVSSTIYEMGVWRHEIYYLKPFMCWLYPEVDLEVQRLMPFSNWSNTRNLSQKLVIPLASTKQRLGFRPWWDLLICFFSELFITVCRHKLCSKKGFTTTVSGLPSYHVLTEAKNDQEIFRD